MGATISQNQKARRANWTLSQEAARKRKPFRCRIRQSITKATMPASSTPMHPASPFPITCPPHATDWCLLPQTWSAGSLSLKLKTEVPAYRTRHCYSGVGVADAPCRRRWQVFLQIDLIVRHLEIGSKSEPLSEPFHPEAQVAADNFCPGPSLTSLTSWIAPRMPLGRS
jgi:hypothetical protein